MAHSGTPSLESPLDNYQNNSYNYLEDCSYKGVHWGLHLGEDCDCEAGTKVKSIGRGKVVYARLHPGKLEKGNWGNLVVIAHKNPKTKQVFFSLYAHLNDLQVSKGDRVELGQVIGKIAEANTPENEYWPESHLHFSIYTGPWLQKVLPGYYKESQNLTKLEYWEEPSEFIRRYLA